MIQSRLNWRKSLNEGLATLYTGWACGHVCGDCINEVHWCGNPSPVWDSLHGELWTMSQEVEPRTSKWVSMHASISLYDVIWPSILGSCDFPTVIEWSQVSRHTFISLNDVMWLPHSDGMEPGTMNQDKCSLWSCFLLGYFITATKMAVEQTENWNIWAKIAPVLKIPMLFLS